MATTSVVHEVRKAIYDELVTQTTTSGSAFESKQVTFGFEELPKGTSIRLGNEIEIESEDFSDF